MFHNHQSPTLIVHLPVNSKSVQVKPVI